MVSRKFNMKKLLFLLSSLLFAGESMATIKTENIDYSSNGTMMQGYLAYDDAKKGPRPGILIVHDWMGLGSFTKEKAEKLAKEGYVAFAVDIYGKGIRPKDQKEAAEFANQYKNDRPLLRKHIRAAYDKLVGMKEVNPNKILVMGYCFGGTTALELARSGVPLVGTVSFHGGLSTPTPEDAKNIKGRVLVMHGADDPNVPPAEVEAFKDEMKKANVNMKFIAYPGAVHGFTNKEAGNDNSKGVAYNAEADRKSWEEFEKFLKEVF
jgi:dienelactone hydrolase